MSSESFLGQEFTGCGFTAYYVATHFRRNSPEGAVNRKDEEHTNIHPMLRINIDPVSKIQKPNHPALLLKPKQRSGGEKHMQG
jgi:hypothetical protein